MKVFIVVDVVTTSPENPGASVFSTLKAANAAAMKMRNEAGDSDEYIVEVIEAELQP